MSEVQTSKQSNLQISFCYKHGKVRIFRRVIEAIGKPEFIQIIIIPEQKLLFIRALDHREHDSFPVVYTENSRHQGMVLHGQRFIRKMCEIAGWTLDETHVLTGTYIEQLNAVEFTLSQDQVSQHQNAEQ